MKSVLARGSWSVLTVVISIVSGLKAPAFAETIVIDRETAKNSISDVVSKFSELGLQWTCYTHGRGVQEVLEGEGAWSQYRFYVGVAPVKTKSMQEAYDPKRIKIVILEFGKNSPSRVRLAWQLGTTTSKAMVDWLLPQSSKGDDEAHLVNGIIFLGGASLPDSEATFFFRRGTTRDGDFMFFKELYVIGEQVNNASESMGNVGLVVMQEETKKDYEFGVAWFSLGSPFSEIRICGPSILPFSADFAELSIEAIEVVGRQWQGYFVKWPTDGGSLISIGRRGYAARFNAGFRVSCSSTTFETSGPTSDSLKQFSGFWTVHHLSPQNQLDLVRLSVCSRKIWQSWNRIVSTDRWIGTNQAEPIPVDPALWAVVPIVQALPSSEPQKK